MVLIGSDFHPSWQQVSWLDGETGETGDQKLVHEAGSVEKFYRQFPAGSRIGMEATGNCQWFLELMAKLGHEVLVGDAAKIRASDSRQQKHDKRDARLLVQLLAEDRFPRIWVPSREEKDLRQLLIHRYKLVRIRAQVKNGLQHLALNQGLQRKKRLWSEAGQKALCELPLAPWASRRQLAQGLLSRFTPQPFFPLQSLVQRQMLQPVLHLRANSHQLVAVNQQLPQIFLFPRRNPDPRKPILRQ